jgi:hypothetical protein
LKRRQDRHQVLRLRIDRRARELAARYQADLFRAMLFDLYSGRISEEALPYWEPLTGGIGQRHGSAS